MQDSHMLTPLVPRPILGAHLALVRRVPPPPRTIRSRAAELPAQEQRGQPDGLIGASPGAGAHLTPSPSAGSLPAHCRRLSCPITLRWRPNSYKRLPTSTAGRQGLQRRRHGCCRSGVDRARQPPRRWESMGSNSMWSPPRHPYRRSDSPTFWSGVRRESAVSSAPANATVDRS